MYKRNKIGLILLSFLLNTVILLPISVQFIHALEDHEHIICFEESTHLHETKSNCEVCDFNFTPFVCDLNNNTLEVSVFAQNNLIENTYNYLYSSELNTYKKLRGPPPIS